MNMGLKGDMELGGCIGVVVKLTSEAVTVVKVDSFSSGFATKELPEM